MGMSSIKVVNNRIQCDRGIGHVYFYYELDDGRPDIVCCTANASRLAPFGAAVAHYGAPNQQAVKGATVVKDHQEVGLWPQSGELPHFVLTFRPLDYAEFGEREAMHAMEEVLEACQRVKARTLRMTQFCMVLNQLPVSHIRGVCRALNSCNRAYPEAVMPSGLIM